MKIVAIMGSSRKGDSYKATRMVEENLKHLDEVDFEYVHLKDADIKICTGCHTCFFKGEQRCPLKDDVQTIKEKMLNADGVIIVSPVYSQQVTALLKNFFDRLSYLYHRPEMFHKKGLMLTSSAGGSVFKDMFKYMKSNSEAWGMDVVDVLGLSILDSLKPAYRSKEIDRIKKASLKFYKALLDKRLTKPSLFKLIWFKVWKATIEIPDTSNTDPENFFDRKYWKEKGWLGKKAYYYYDTKINIFKKGISKLMEKIIGYFFKKTYV